MDYGMAVMTALATFISPCVLPLLPVFVTYFAANDGEEFDENGEPLPKKRRILKTFFNALAFCIGFSIFFLVTFTALAFASNAFKGFIDDHKQQMYAICGIVLVLLGLKFMGYLNLPFMDKKINIKTKTVNMNILNAFVLGLVYSLSIGSCAFVFMSVNIMDVILGASVFKGIMIGVIFTVTLCSLFLICAMLIDQLKGVFSFIKRHYKVINIVMGSIMIVLGVLIAVGFLEMVTRWIS